MLPLMLFFLVIMSGSFFCAVRFNERFERTLVITILVYVLLSFLLGMIGLLRYSVYVILVISSVLYVLGIYELVKRRNIKEFVSNFFTPGLFVFLVLSVVFLKGIRGKLFTDSDEFSHWGDVVKVIVQTGDFGSDPASGSLFKSYPPGISLFQYLFERLGYLVSGVEFAEWYCYYALDILYLAVILPVLSHLSFRNVTGLVVVMLAIVGLPYVYFEPSFVTLYAELLLAFMFGGMLLDLLWNDEKDIFFDIRYLLALSFMVLAKDSGLLFSILLGIAYLFVKRKNYLAVIAAVAIPKFLWSLDNSINHVAKSFGNSFDIVSLFNVFIGKETGYRREVMQGFGEELLYNYIHLGDFGLYASYLAVAIVLIVLSIIVVYFAYRKCKADKGKTFIVGVAAVLSFVIYMFGLMITYMYKFSQEEALELTSFYRYVVIVYLGLSLFVVFSFVLFIEGAKFNKIICNLVLIALLVVIVPVSDVRILWSGAHIGASRTLRSEIQEYIDLSNELIEDDSKVWFIYEDAADSEARLAYKFGIRPSMVDGDASIRANEEEGSEVYSAEEWMNELIDKGYDYVAPYYIDEQFIEDYGCLFENNEDIGDGRIYRVNTVDGKLEFVG